MKNINTVILSTLLLSSVALADDNKQTLVEALKGTNTFVAVSVGYANLNVTNKGTVALNEKLNESANNFNVELGYKYSNKIDLSLNYKRVNLDDTGLDNLYASLKYKLIENKKLNPYLGLNLGYSQLSWDKAPINTPKNDTQSGSFLIGTTLGVLYKVTNNVSLDVNYQLDYMRHKTKIENYPETSTLIHDYLQSVNLGIRYSF